MATVVSQTRTAPPELKEYLVGGLHLLASPKDMMSLTMRRQSDLRLNDILTRFEDPKTRQRMFDFCWRLLDSQCEYRYKNKSSPYFTDFGVRGIGKSEFAMALMERCRDQFERILGQRPIPGFGRNPSGINELLEIATNRSIPAVIIGDETESEVGIGSLTNERALIENLETQRLLQHTIIRCANRFKRLLSFSYYCDFVFEVIFSDRINRINYAIMYNVDAEISESDPRVPVGIIDMPLHKNEELRAIYEKSKRDEQTAFTGGGGRRSRLRYDLEPTVQSVVDYCRRRGVRVGRGCEISRPKDLLRIMVFEDEIVNGDKWNTAESELVYLEAFSRLTKEGSGAGKGEGTPADTPGGTRPVPVKTIDYQGQTEDLRAAVIKRLIERGNDPQKVRAFEIYVTRRISQDNVALALKAEGVTAAQPTIHSWVRDMAGTEEYFEATELGFAYEDVFSLRLTNQGVKHIKGGGNTPQPDIIVFTDDGNSFKEVISLKCFVQRRDSYSITRDKIGERELQFAKNHGIPCYLRFYDIWHNIEYDPVLITDQNTYNFHA